MYQDLKKLYHIDENRARSVYEARLSDPSKVDLEIAGKHFFYWMPPDVFSMLLKIERADRFVCDLANSLPKNAVDRYVVECMIDEIVLTNEIEGVLSTRKQVELALEALKKHDKRKRFQGIVNKYNSLIAKDDISLQTLEDVRALYDDLVLDEVIEDDPKDAPDGKLFRKGEVNVVDAAQHTIHKSVLSEEQINEGLIKGLALYNDVNIEPLIRAALFHFIFAYTHPFYDGNGRMNRFISSSLIYNEASEWAGIRLSHSAKENIKEYYKAFQLAEHSLNRGDLTPFILTFLDITLDALTKTSDALEEKGLSMRRAQEKLLTQYGVDSAMDVNCVGSALLQGSLFTMHGLTIDELSKETGLSIPTVYKRMDLYKEKDLIVRKRQGRKVFFSLAIDKIED